MDERVLNYDHSKEEFVVEGDDEFHKAFNDYLFELNESSLDCYDKLDITITVRPRDGGKKKKT